MTLPIRILEQVRANLIQAYCLEEDSIIQEAHLAAAKNEYELVGILYHHFIYDDITLEEMVSWSLWSAVVDKTKLPEVFNPAEDETWFDNELEGQLWKSGSLTPMIVPDYDSAVALVDKATTMFVEGLWHILHNYRTYLQRYGKAMLIK